MKKQIYVSPGEGPFRLTVTSSDQNGDPTIVRLWFADAEGNEHLRVEISGDADYVIDVHRTLLSCSRLIQDLIRDADPEHSVVKAIEEAEEAVREATTAGGQS